MKIEMVLIIGVLIDSKDYVNLKNLDMILNKIDYDAKKISENTIAFSEQVLIGESACKAAITLRGVSRILHNNGTDLLFKSSNFTVI